MCRSMLLLAALLLRAGVLLYGDVCCGLRHPPRHRSMPRAFTSFSQKQKLPLPTDTRLSEGKQPLYMILGSDIFFLYFTPSWPGGSEQRPRNAHCCIQTRHIHYSKAKYWVKGGLRGRPWMGEVAECLSSSLIIIDTPARPRSYIHPGVYTLCRM